MARQHLAQHGGLALHGLGIQAGAGTSALGNVQPGEFRQQQRRRRGIGNAHLAQQQCIARQLLHQCLTLCHRLRTLGAGHGRAPAGVARTPGALAHLQPRSGRARWQALQKVVHDATIHHGECQPVLPCQHTDCGATGQKVLHHLPGDLTGKSRYATRRQPMVGSKHHQLRLVQHRILRAQDLAQLQRQVFQTPQRSARLGLVVQLVLQGLGQQRIGDVGELGQVLVHGVHRLSG